MLSTAEGDANTQNDFIHPQIMASRSLIDGDVRKSRIGDFVGYLKVEWLRKDDTESGFNAGCQTVNLPPPSM